MALQVTWNADSTIKIPISHSDEPIGTGIEKFIFADGSWLSMRNMIDMAPMHPDFDAQVAAFSHGAGGHLLETTPGAVFADTGFTAANVTVSRNGEDLVLSGPGGEDSLRISSWYADIGATPSTSVYFSDGTVWDIATLYAMGLANEQGGPHSNRQGISSSEWWEGIEGQAYAVYGDAGDDTLTGAELGDTLYGGDGNDMLDGRDGNDELRGESGNDRLLGGWTGNNLLIGGGGQDGLWGGADADTLDGGSGNDELYGYIGSDTYVFGFGSGQDMVGDYDATAGNLDTVLMADSVVPANVVVTRETDNLVLSLGDSTDRIMLTNWFIGNDYKIEQVKFTDGTIWGVADLVLQLNRRPIVTGALPDVLSS